MATLREIRRRILGIKSTQQITKAMKMVATAKLRRAQDAIIAARPYARHMQELISYLVTKVDPSLHPLLSRREERTIALIVVTSDRGLCGAFNTNLFRFTEAYIAERSNDQQKNDRKIFLYLVGRKGNDYFSKQWKYILGRQINLFQTLNFGNARAIMDTLVTQYIDGTIDRVDVVYNEFKSVIQQRIVIEQLLPIPPKYIQPNPQDLRTLAQVDYIYEPSAQDIINALLPKHLNIQMWRILLESNAAEQAARRMAMDNATENANELLSLLQLEYNKARQASITKELLEIVSGAEALKKGLE